VNLSALSGMQAGLRLVDSAARTTASFGASADPAAGGPPVDLAVQVARLITGTLAYTANARVLESQDQVTRSAIDIVA
jgi:flagellar hook protein FlgE